MENRVEATVKLGKISAELANKHKGFLEWNLKTTMPGNHQPIVEVFKFISLQNSLKFSLNIFLLNFNFQKLCRIMFCLINHYFCKLKQIIGRETRELVTSWGEMFGDNSFKHRAENLSSPKS